MFGHNPPVPSPLVPSPCPARPCPTHSCPCTVRAQSRPWPCPCPIRAQSVRAQSRPWLCPVRAQSAPSQALSQTDRPSELIYMIYQILHFKHYKNINFENSYFIEIFFKWNDSSFFLKKLNNVHNYIYFLLKF